MVLDAIHSISSLAFKETKAINEDDPYSPNKKDVPDWISNYMHRHRYLMCFRSCVYASERLRHFFRHAE